MADYSVKGIKRAYFLPLFPAFKKPINLLMNAWAIRPKRQHQRMMLQARLNCHLI